MGGRASQGFGLLLVGGVVGAWVARVSQADGWVLALVGLIGVAFIGGGVLLDKCAARRKRTAETARLTEVMGFAARGDTMLHEIEQWSMLHRSWDPSVGSDPAVAARLGKEFAELRQRTRIWKQEAGDFVVRGFGGAVAGFDYPVPISPPPGKVVHPYLQEEWSTVRSRIAWLVAHADPVPAIALVARSPQPTKRDLPPQPPGPGAHPL
jgi:hypothetical protein